MNWLSLLPFALFFGWFVLYAARSRRNCPDCGERLRGFQSPLTKTGRQWMEGGYVCEHCGCESDLSGNPVAPGTPLRWRSVVLGMGLVVLAPALVGLAGVMLALLQQP